MQRYLISFDDGSMDHITDEDLPAVSEASRAVVAEAKAAGVWIWGGGVVRQRASIVGVDGSVVDGPSPETKAVVGGFSIMEVSSREEALAWAAKIAVGLPVRSGGPGDRVRPGVLRPDQLSSRGSTCDDAGRGGRPRRARRRSGGRAGPSRTRRRAARTSSRR